MAYAALNKNICHFWDRNRACFLEKMRVKLKLTFTKPGMHFITHVELLHFISFTFGPFSNGGQSSHARDCNLVSILIGYPFISFPNNWNFKGCPLRIRIQLRSIKEIVSFKVYSESISDMYPILVDLRRFPRESQRDGVSERKWGM